MRVIPGTNVSVYYPSLDYRLNEARWRDSLRRIELEIHCLKDQMRKPNYQETFDWQLLLKLRAEATRLYAIRAASRRRIHPVQSGFRFAFHPRYKLPFLHFFRSRWLNLEPADLQDLLVNDDPDWVLGLLEPRAVAAAS